MGAQPPLPPGSAAARKGGKFGEWVRKNKAVAIGGGAVALIAVIYLVQKNGAASSASGAAGTTGTTVNPAVDSAADPAAYDAAMQSLLDGLGSYATGGGSGSGSGGGTVGGSGSPAPTSGRSGAQNVFAITAAQARTLLTGGQRPFVWNGSSYVPATSIVAGQAYYAGPLESKELGSSTGPFKPKPKIPAPKPRPPRKTPLKIPTRKL